MQKLTSKEKIELEQVFSAIYVNKNSRFTEFYRTFYSNFSCKMHKMKTRIRYIKRKMR